MKSKILSPFRIAGSHDVFKILQLYQRAKTSIWQDILFLDYKRLERAIASKSALWIVSERQNRVIAALSIIFDVDQGLSKITRMLVDPEVSDPKEELRSLLHYSLATLKLRVPGIEIIYTTTLSMTLEQQEITLEEGFKILGVFPNAFGEDQSRLNGISAIFLDEVLVKKRYQDFKIHQITKPFFDLAQQACGLPDVQIIDKIPRPPSRDYDPLPTLEMIRAARFVHHRFQELKRRRSQFLNFFPFHSPNTVITSPAQDLEIFVRITEDRRFAAIIGEHMERSVDPVKMYESVLKMLHANNVSYVEVINDAGDAFGTDCIIRAGFTPCAYLPAFKRQNHTRRDFVVFGRSFEYLCKPDLQDHRPYFKFYLEYLRAEQRNYMDPSIIELLTRPRKESVALTVPTAPATRGDPIL